jgi:hypothetical protein
MKYRKDKRWTVAELLDYDYFLYLDKSISALESTPRDRKIYLAASAPRNAHRTRRKLARIWLNARRKQSPDIALPSATFSIANKIINWSIAGLGILIGLLYGFGVLKYTGKEAINLLIAFILLVLLPLISSIITFIMIIARKYISNRNTERENPLIQMIYQKVTKHLTSSEQKRRGTEAFFNHISIRLKKYGTAPMWLLAVRLQLFAFMIPLGSLLAVLLGGSFHDLAFAWQTTTNVTPETIHNIVTLISSPWHNWAPSGVPTLENVAGSRVILKEGISSLNSADLSAWWKFICYSIFFYAVLPRGILIDISWIAEKITLLKIDFKDAESSALFRRMTSPIINPDNENFIPDPPLRAATKNNTLPIESYHANAIFNIIIPDDIAPITEEEIKTAINTNLHGKCNNIFTITLDEEQDIHIWKKIKAQESILIIQEGWQPCTIEYLDYIKALRKAIEKKQLIVIGLTGKPSPNNKVLHELDDEIFNDWRYQLSTLHDTALESMKLII